MVRKRRLKTARCILYRDDEYFLVMHHTRIFSAKKRWAFPGGRIEWGEESEAAVVRELREELYISVNHVEKVGDYKYKGHDHRVFAAEFTEKIDRFDRSEITRIGWHSLGDVRELKDSGLLHAGFELEAILDFSEHR